MAKKGFSPRQFSDSARSEAAARLAAAQELIEAAMGELKSAQLSLSEDAGSEGTAFPFFRDHLSDLSELNGDLELLVPLWTPESK